MTRQHSHKLLRQTAGVFGLSVVITLLAGCASPAPAPVSAPPSLSAPSSTATRPAGLPAKPNYTPGPNDPQAFFFEPGDGQLVQSPVLIRLGVANLQAPKGAFYFHIAIDTPCTTPGQPFPEDSSHVRLDQGTDISKLPLPTGTHRLCLQLSTDGKTAPSEPGLQQVIDIVVE